MPEVIENGFKVKVLGEFSDWSQLPGEFKIMFDGDIVTLFNKC